VTAAASSLSLGANKQRSRDSKGPSPLRTTLNKDMAKDHTMKADLGADMPGRQGIRTCQPLT